jgi:trans-aconitate 2-methyltransferase
MDNPNVQHKEPTAHDVKAYYDSFMASTMLSYRLTENPRIDSAAELVSAWSKNASSVLDVGCGIGILTERIAKKARRAQVVGVDISEQNIWYARKTVKEQNVTFYVWDVAAEPKAISGLLQSPPDTVILIDVIEHIPAELRAPLLSSLCALSAQDALLVLTYPSASYQDWLKKFHPERLQIIDNSIEASIIASEAESAGYKLRFYKQVSIFRPHDYVHAVFSKGLPQWLNTKSQDSIGRRILRLKARLLAPFRRRRYVTSVFKRGNSQEVLR